MTKVVVKRAEWLRGTLDSCLLRRADNKKCCLGFACLASGLTEDQIRGFTAPAADGVDHIAREHLPSLVDSRLHNTEISKKLMEVNDDLRMNDAERESKLIGLGAQAGIAFEFID